MRKVLLLSPHFDDAVLSAGQFLAGRPSVDVVTVFGGYPKAVQKTDYDKKCGFYNSKEAIKERRNEDDEALALLEANPIHWEFADEQYGETPSHEKVFDKLSTQIKQNDYQFIMGPLGLGHPDHEFVHKLLLSLQFQSFYNGDIYFWEDMPTRVVYPELVFEKLQTHKFETVFPGDGPIAKKIRSLSCYRSQIGTGILDPYVMYVPERFWKIV